MKFSYVVLFFLLTGFSTVAQPSPKTKILLKHETDSLRQRYRLAKTDTGKINILLDISNVYYNKNDFENALVYADYVKLIAEKLKRSNDSNLVRAGLNGGAEYYAQEGDVSCKRGNYAPALNYYNQALKLFMQAGNRDKVARTYSSISGYYSSMGEYGKSLKTNFEALKISEALKDEKSIAIDLNNIGAIYTDLKMNSKALEYHLKAVEISVKQGDKRSFAMYTGNVGGVYQRMCDSAYAAGNTKLSLQLQDKALSYYSKALSIAQQIDNRDDEAVWLENIGIVYNNVFDFKKALPYLLKAFDIYKELQLKPEQSYCAQNIGAAYHGLHDDKKAEAFFKQSVELARETGSPHYLMEAAISNSDFYSSTKRPEQAFNFYKEFIANRDSMFNRNNTNAFARTELNYEFEKKQAELKFKNDKIIYELEAGNRLDKQLRLFLILVIVLAVVLLFFAKRAYDNKKRVAEFLGSESKRKEVLLQEVHHRINNNLQIISSLLSLQANSAQDEKLYEYLTQSQNRIQSLAVLHDLLYQADSPLQINMREYLDKVMNYHRDILSTLPAKVEVDMDIEDVEFQTKMAVPIALVINELVTNSIKYAFKDSKTGKIQISLRRMETKWRLYVSDSGNGIPADKPVRKDSLGLRLITIMTKQMNGVLTKSNSPGATFEIVFG